MNYRQIICENDRDIPYLSSVHRLPEIAKYISIDEANFWHYVTTSENVFYYKVYEEDYLVATLHCEISHKTLYISVLVIPEYQNKGLGTSIIQDIITGKLPLDFEEIEVSIDESNIPSIRLFERMKFNYLSKDDELLIYVYQK